MICVHAFAKLNLSLSVLGSRPDGFHEIDSLVQTIDLADHLSVGLRDTGIDVENDLPGLRGRDLAEVAAEKILLEKGSSSGVTIRIRKGIPAGAGLGGGSSDAAAVIAVLNWLIAPALPLPALLRVAADVGADVPLFFRGGLLRMTGRGEILESAGRPMSGRFVILVPAIECDTGEVYRAFDGSRQQARGVAPLGENGLLAPALSVYPGLARYHEAIRALGAEYFGMSGSGSAFYGAFADAASAAAAAKSLRRDLPGDRVFECSATSKGHCITEGGR
jgi:4-diphosphocytidyl-2-C-methyl-D-erythritol kinase